MTYWFCEKCLANKLEDCGPWDDQSDIFKQIKSFHRGHLGFQIGEPRLTGKANWGHTEIEKEFTEALFKHGPEIFHELVANLKGRQKVCLLREKWRHLSQA